jgi:NTP pyrophosphatase (non-canonical NTP hydrolase)
MPELTIGRLLMINLRRCTEDFNHQLNDWSVLEWGGATAGEVGEACNVAKKLVRIRDGFDKMNKGATAEELKSQLGKEMADTIHYMCLWSIAAGIDLEEALVKTFNEISEKYGSKYRL